MNYFLYFIVTAFITLSTSLTYSYGLTFAWDSNTEPDLEGYRLYSREGNPCPPYDLVDTYPENELANPLNPMVEIDGLEPNVKYYFVVAAYDTAGNESDFSKIISVINRQWEYANCSSRSSSRGSGGGGGSGG
jgi:hypothetical protein